MFRALLNIVIACVMVLVNLISVLLFFDYICKLRNERKRKEEEQRERYYNLHSYKDVQDKD